MWWATDQGHRNSSSSHDYESSTNTNSDSIVTDYRLYTRNIKRRTKIYRYSSHSATSSVLLSVRVYCRCDLNHASSSWLDRVIVWFKGLARDNAIDICLWSVSSCEVKEGGREYLPVRMAENASDTLEASKADVSINNNPFWAAEESISVTSSQRRGRQLTGKGSSLIRGHGSEVLQITLVTNQHDDNVGIRVVSKFL